MKGAVMRPARPVLSLVYLRWCRLAIICLGCARTANTTVYMNNHCHKSISNKGDIIKSQDSLYYAPYTVCETVINVDHHSRVLLQIHDMNIVSDFECTHSYLDVFPVVKQSATDSDHVRMCNITQIHRHILSQGSYLRLRLVNNAGDVGRGFSGVFSTLYPTGKTLSCREHDYFHCSNGFCISSDLTCDTINHCGDNSDEGTEHCKEPEINWMDIKKGPISVVEMTFTLIGLIIIGVVVTVVITNCCKDLMQRRKLEQLDELMPANWKRNESFSAQLPGHRVPIQRTRSTTYEYSARNAAQEDLRYLRQISSSLTSDEVFEETEGLVSTSPKRKLSFKSIDNVKKVENNFHELHKNDAVQPEEEPRERRKKLSSSHKTVTFTIGDSDTDTPDETMNTAEDSYSRKAKRARRVGIVSSEEQTQARNVPSFTKERRKMFALKSTGFTIQEEHGEGVGGERGTVERGEAPDLEHQRPHGKISLPRRSSHQRWYDLNENNVSINENYVSVNCEREKLLSTTGSEGSMEAKLTSKESHDGTQQDQEQVGATEQSFQENGDMNVEDEVPLGKDSISYTQDDISDQNANLTKNVLNGISIAEGLCDDMDFVLETEI